MVAACVLFLTSCSRHQAIEPLLIQVQQGNNQVRCTAPFEHQGRIWQFDALKWYMSNIEVEQAGRWRPLPLTNNSYQQDGIALIEFDVCRPEQPLKLTLAATVEWHNISALSFDLGLPFAINHANPLQQPAPINRADMFWSWQLGHKFLRLDMRSGDHNWGFHLGSIGCLSTSAVRAPHSACKHPNLFRFEVATAGRQGRLVFDLEPLLDGLNLATDSGCRFHGKQAQSCAQLLANLTEHAIFKWQ